MIGKKFDELRLTGALPTPSVVGLRILEITKADDYDQLELEQTIMADPALSGRILKLANSAAYEGRAGVADIHQAALRLGGETVRSVALGFTLILEGSRASSDGFDYDQHWARSLATGVAASILSQYFKGLGAADAFTCGLLCDVGTLALASVHPDRYSALASGAPGADGLQMAELEGRAFDINHYEVGAAMLSDWGLPEEFQRAILLQGKPGTTIDEAPLQRLIRVLEVSRVVADALVASGKAASGEDLKARALRSLDRAAESLDLELDTFLAVCDEIDQSLKDWVKVLALSIEDHPPISARYAQLTAPRGSGSEGAPLAVQQERLKRAVSPPSIDSARENAGSCGPDVTRILLIDDDQNMLKLLGYHLRREGYEVLTATSSEEGLATALSMQPQLVVTDWMMPGMSGLELCRTLRQSDAGRRMYVLIVTSREDDDQVLEAFAAGADDYIVKPFNPRILRARIRAGERMVTMRQQVEAAERVGLQQVAELGIMTRRLRAAAMTDHLTDLPNRRYGMKQLKQEWDSSLRTGRPLSVVLADIDHFKEVNDRFGHDAGDAVLREISELLRKIARSGNVLCRLGGEEFLEIDVASSAADAALGAERLRSGVEQMQIRYPGFEGQVTLSLGVAQREAHMASVDDLIKAADEALYVAKAQGRNRIFVADPDWSGRKGA